MQNNLKTQLKIFAPILYVILFILMIIGTFNDLAIDKALFDYNHPFAVNLAVWGMWPQYSMQLFGYTILLACYHPLDEAFDIAESLFPFFKYLRANKITHSILFVLHKVMYIAMIYGAFMGADEILSFIYRNADGHYTLYHVLLDKGYSTAIAALCWNLLRMALVIVTYIIIKQISKKHKKAFELTAIIGLLIYYFYISNGAMDGIKHIFHRIRFREMIAQSAGLFDEEGRISIGSTILQKEWIETTDFSWFTRWYKIGQDNGVLWQDPTSFPSGHTTAAAFAMLLIPLSYKINKKSLFIPLSLVGTAYTACVGLSRLIRGAHYLTDVTAATIIMFTLILVITIILSKVQDISDKKLEANK